MIPIPKFKSCEEIAEKLRKMNLTVTYVGRHTTDKSVCIINFRTSRQDENIYNTSSLTYDLRTGKGQVNIIKVIPERLHFFEFWIGTYCKEPYTCRIHIDRDTWRVGLHATNVDIDKEFKEILIDMQVGSNYAEWDK